MPHTGYEPEGEGASLPGPVGQPVSRVLRAAAGGLDGIKNKIEPPAPIDKNIYELPPEEYGAIESVPTSLEAVLTDREEDQEYLTEGDVFLITDVIETSIDFKRTQEIAPLAQRPHPHEFGMY